MWYCYDDLDHDTWDALTDGQYGEYPGGDVDYDIFGFQSRSLLAGFC